MMAIAVYLRQLRPDTVTGISADFLTTVPLSPYRQPVPTAPRRSATPHCQFQNPPPTCRNRATMAPLPRHLMALPLHPLPARIHRHFLEPPTFPTPPPFAKPPPIWHPTPPMWLSHRQLLTPQIHRHFLEPPHFPLTWK